MPATIRLAACLAISTAAPVAMPAEAAPPGDPPVLTDAECEVWARELSFAQSVADHDAAAFAEHLHPEAAFGSSLPKPDRGRDAIAASWANIVAGNGIALHWYPTRVTIAGEGDIAWSSGPSVVEHLDPKAKHRYTMGGFHSVWHRGEDGTWHVLFDDGIPSRPATAEDVAAFHAGRREACPQG